MALSAVRTQIYLDREQHEALKAEAEKRSVSMAEVVREAVATFLAAVAPRPQRLTASSRPEDPAWRLVEAADEIGGSGPGADASRLEDELYGRPLAS